MAIPVVNLTTSILGYQQWVSWAYQPAATGSPTSWAASSVPPGMSFSTTTGMLSGAVSMPGVYLVNLTAHNADGDSLPVMLTIGIDPASGSNKSGIDLSIDTGTGAVTVGSAALKEDDDMMFYVTFTKGGSPIDIGTLTGLKVTIKEQEPDPYVIQGTSFASLGGGAISPKYLLYAKLDSSATQGAMSNYEARAGTTFDAICEIEWLEPLPSGVTFSPSTGLSSVRRSSQLFTLPIWRNVTPA